MTSHPRNDARSPRLILFVHLFLHHEAFLNLCTDGESQDSTLITSASGKKHADDATDWKWWHSSVPKRIKKLYEEDGLVASC
jgi:hypothetical protein